MAQTVPAPKLMCKILQIDCKTKVTKCNNFILFLSFYFFHTFQSIKIREMNSRNPYVNLSSLKKVGIVGVGAGTAEKFYPGPEPHQSHAAPQHWFVYCKNEKTIICTF
jgi:hypothetical protein